MRPGPSARRCCGSWTASTTSGPRTSRRGRSRSRTPGPRNLRHLHRRARRALSRFGLRPRRRRRRQRHQALGGQLGREHRRLRRRHRLFPARAEPAAEHHRHWQGRATAASKARWSSSTPAVSGGFQNGETATFSGDMDPNSIAGLRSRRRQRRDPGLGRRRRLGPRADRLGLRRPLRRRHDRHRPGDEQPQLVAAAHAFATQASGSEDRQSLRQRRRPRRHRHLGRHAARR